MIKTIERLMCKAEETDYRLRDMEQRFREHEFRSELLYEYVRLHFEATEPTYQDRLWVIGAYSDIKQYTLAEIECIRFMTDRQFNDLRASKK